MTWRVADHPDHFIPLSRCEILSAFCISDTPTNTHHASQRPLAATLAVQLEAGRTLHHIFYPCLEGKVCYRDNTDSPDHTSHCQYGRAWPQEDPDWEPVFSSIYRSRGTHIDFSRASTTSPLAGANMRNNGVVCSSSNCLPAGNVPSRSVLNVDSIVAHHPGKSRRPTSAERSMYGVPAVSPCSTPSRLIVPDGPSCRQASQRNSTTEREFRLPTTDVECYPTSTNDLDVEGST